MTSEYKIVTRIFLTKVDWTTITLLCCSLQEKGCGLWYGGPLDRNHNTNYLLLLEKRQTPGSASDKYSIAWLPSCCYWQTRKSQNKLAKNPLVLWRIFSAGKIFADLWVGVMWERPVLTHYVPFTIYFS